MPGKIMAGTRLISFLVFLFLLNTFPVQACQCPLTTLGIAECDKYEIIFKGKVLSVVPCGQKFGEAVFEIQELYKGNAASSFKMLFECGGECAVGFKTGEEWIIYSRYKQIDNALMDWCSRSRKQFSNEKEDFYAVTYGNDYDDELSFLREHLGLHRLLKDEITLGENRNLLPKQWETALLFIASLLVIVLFYWLFNRFFKF
jgi:hypothetical protein